MSYFTDNILWRLLIYGGYYSLGIMAFGVLLAVFLKSFRTFIASFSMAMFAIYLLILIYEVIEEMSWIPSI